MTDHPTAASRSIELCPPGSELANPGAYGSILPSPAVAEETELWLSTNSQHSYWNPTLFVWNGKRRRRRERARLLRLGGSGAAIAHGYSIANRPISKKTTKRASPKASCQFYSRSCTTMPAS